MSDEHGGDQDERPETDQHDTRFGLPDLEADPDTEIGVILMGLRPERLLAGLGVAATTPDAGTATLLVDQLRHDARPGSTFADAVTAGAGRWRAVRSALLAAAQDGGVRSAALRQLWAGAATTVASAGLAGLGPAERTYLAACWLRRVEIDHSLEDDHVSSELPSR